METVTYPEAGAKVDVLASGIVGGRKGGRGLCQHKYVIKM